MNNEFTDKININSNFYVSKVIEEDYDKNIKKAKKILEDTKTEIPDIKEKYIKGVVHIHNKIIPVIDFKNEEKHNNFKEKILITRLDNCLIGILVKNGSKEVDIAEKNNDNIVGIGRIKNNITLIKS